MAEKQYHVQLGPGDVGRYVILPGDPGRVPYIASFFDHSKLVAQNREYTTYTGDIDGIKLSAVSTGIGCPSAAICIEELAKIGADTFIRVGTAGSLQRKVGLGHLVVSTASVRDEGTTRQYVPLEFPSVADLDVTLALREAAAKLGFPHHVGISHCKDAFFSEGGEGLPLEHFNHQRWQAWQKAGVLSTSMESAALFVISSIRGLRCGEVVAIVGLTHDDAPIINAKVGIEEAVRTAIEAVKILHRRDTENPA